jgi:hypothetical protein
MTVTRRLHIVGCRRSGTTLMMELLWYAYHFSGRHEHEISVFEPIPEEQTLYLSKKPPDTTHIERIFLQDEQLFLIAMLRDPRAVITSKHPSQPNVYFSDYHRWHEYVRALSAFHGHPRFLLVRYEDLVTDPAQQQTLVSQKFPFLEPQRPFEQFPQGARVPQRAQRSLGGARPFEAARIGGWREHLPRVKGQLLAHPDMPRMLIEAGYETDDTWLTSLDSVEPYQQQYKDGGPSALRRLETNLRFAWKTRSYLRRLTARPTAAN